MVWHPQGPRDREDELDRRLAFLERFAAVADGLLPREEPPEIPGDLPPELQAAGPSPDPALLPAVAALDEAAALAFVGDRTGEGVRLAAQALERLAEGGPSMSPVLRLGILAAVTGGGELALGVEGVRLILGRATSFFYWDGMYAAAIQQIAGGLISASLATGGAGALLEFMAAPEPANETARIAQVLVRNAPEFDLVSLLPAEDPRGMRPLWRLEPEAAALASLVSLHQRYAARVRLLAVDEFRDRQLRWRVPLLDWTLLCAHLAILRFAGRAQSDRLVEQCGSATAGEQARFLRDLAVEIDGLDRFGGRGGYPHPELPPFDRGGSAAPVQYARSSSLG